MKYNNVSNNDNARKDQLSLVLYARDIASQNIEELQKNQRDSKDQKIT